MDVKTFLLEQGLTEEEVKGMDTKTAKVLATALGRYEEGSTALATAQEESKKAADAKKEAEEFWDQKVTPALAGVDKRIATASSETARYKAYLASLKEQGYDVPDDLIAAPKKEGVDPARDPESGKWVTPDQLGKEIRSVAPTMVSLVALSNEYQDLYGSPYVTADADWEEAQKSRKPFREFVRDKYKFAAKKSEREQAKLQKDKDDYAADKVKAAQAQWAERHGENPELRSPMASKFDKIEKMAERKDSWKTSTARDAARKDRLVKFSNLTLQ